MGKNEKKFSVKLSDIPNHDVLPEVSEMIAKHIQLESEYWGNAWFKTFIEPKTHEDLLFGCLEDLRETALRIQTVLMRQKTKTDNELVIDADKLLKHYIENIKRHIGTLIIRLEDMGFDMKTPPPY